MHGSLPAPAAAICIAEAALLRLCLPSRFPLATGSILVVRESFAPDFWSLQQQPTVTVPDAEGPAATRCRGLESRTALLAKRAQTRGLPPGRPLSPGPLLTDLPRGVLRSGDMCKVKVESALCAQPRICLR